MSDDHLRRSIRAMSTLGYGAAVVLSFAGLLTLVWLFAPEKFSIRHAGGILMLAFAVLFAVLAHNLRKFRPWARTGTMILCFIGLLGVPLGTLLCGPFLYVLAKSKHLFACGPQPRIVAPGDSGRLAA